MAESDLSNEASATTALPAPTVGDPSVNDNGNVVVPWTVNDDSPDGGIDVERRGSESISGSDGFEDGDLNGWTTYTASVVTDRARGTYSAYSNDNNTVRMMERTLQSGGFQPDYIEWYVQETSSGSYGSGVRLYDSSGNKVVSAATDNPELDIWDGNGYAELYDGNGYDRWIRFRIEFDWDAGTFDLEWEDLQANDLQTFSNRPLIQSTDIEKFEIWNYNAGDWGRGGGDFESWYDDISWGTEPTWTDVATGLAPSTTSYTDTSVSEGTTYDYRVERRTDHATATSNIESVTTALQRAVSVSGTGATDSSRITTESRSASVSATIPVSQSTRKTNKPRASSVSGSRGETVATRIIQKQRQNAVYASGATSSNRSTSKQRSESIHTATLANLASRQTIESRSQTTAGSGASSATRATSRTRSFSSHGSGALTNAAELLEVFPSESSADLDFDMVFSPILGFASEWVEEETVFDGETAAYTTILDINITKPISVYIQYDSDGDGNPDYTAGPRKIKRDNQVISVDELGEDGYYRIIISNMRPPDHLRAITWGPTRF